MSSRDVSSTGHAFSSFGSNQVWTGVEWGGIASANTCLNWTTNTSDFNVAKGYVGTIATTWHYWFNQGAGTCEYARALYCIEQ